MEVLAGLALMASLLTALLYVRMRYARASTRADLGLRAVAAADELLQSWTPPTGAALPTSATRLRIPLDASGDVAGEPRLRWRTLSPDSSIDADLRTRVVRLSIHQAAGDGSSGDPAAPLCSVDVLVPLPTAEEDER